VDTGLYRNAAGVVEVDNGTAGTFATLVAGHVGIGNTSPGALLDIGSAGATLGTMRLEGSTSGYVQLQPPIAAGSWTMTLPNSGGTNGYVLSTNGSGVTSWVAATSSSSGILLGTSASATNPQRTGDAGTGLFSATVGTVSIASAGTDVADFSATSENLIGTITAGSYSIGYKINGNNAAWQDTTNFNVAVGPTAFPTTVLHTTGTTGQGNVAVGVSALNANTTGYADVAVGYSALAVNTTGYQNTAVGRFALQANTTGYQNTAIGNFALFDNTTATGNTAMGAAAAFNNTVGIENTAIGSGTLLANTTGTNNTVLGYFVADTVLNGGSNNILIGTNNAVTTIAAGTNYNLNIGNLLQGDMTNSTALGTEALYLQSTASSVDYLQIAGGATGSPGTVTVSGQGIDSNVNIELLPKGTGNVGIGTAMPAATLDIKGTIDQSQFVVTE
jgi:hypothetical protein